MNSFEKIVYSLQGTMETPTPFGWFHLMWIGITIVSIIVLFLLRKKHNEKQLKSVLLIYGFIALTLEVIKQIIWSFNYDPVTLIKTWDYQWYASPFQLCTMPIYISLICVFLKKSKLRDSLLGFLSFYTIIGSIMTILMPSSCFVTTILVNIHTMWLHCMSFVLSVYLLMSGEIKLSIKNLKNAFYTFVGCVIIALFLNIVMYKTGIIGNETFNMFFISPYFTSTLPVFNVIQENVPYIIFLFIYIILCMIGSILIYMISKFINRIYTIIKKNK